MKVLQVAPYFPPYNGGQEEHVAKLTDHLRGDGHAVKVLTSDYPPESTPDESDDHICRVPVHKRPLRNPLVSPRREMLDLFEWADVAHAHNEHAFLSNVAAVLGTYTDTPMVLTCHGQLSFRSSVSDFVESLYSRTVGARTLQTMDQVIALSDSDRAYLTSLGIDDSDVAVVPNAIEPPSPPVPRAVDEFRESHGLGRQNVVLFVGPIVRRKSPETLLRAMSGIRETHPETVGVFVGSGDHLSVLKSEARSLGVEASVRFTGYLPERELIAAYRSASVLAVPSVSEGMPTTIIEGMAQQLPVVATNLDPICDWFDDCALLVESTPGAFREAISVVLRDEERADRMGRDGLALVRSRLTWERVSTEIARLYEDVVGGRASTVDQSGSATPPDTIDRETRPKEEAFEPV